MIPTITADDVLAFHASGPESHWWWCDQQGVLRILDSPPPTSPGTGAAYLMPWDAAWFAQWDGDWERAAEQLNSILDHITQEA